MDKHSLWVCRGVWCVCVCVCVWASEHTSHLFVCLCAYVCACKCVILWMSAHTINSSWLCRPLLLVRRTAVVSVHLWSKKNINNVSATLLCAGKMLQYFKRSPCRVGLDTGTPPHAACMAQFSRAWVLFSWLLSCLELFCLSLQNSYNSQYAPSIHYQWKTQLSICSFKKKKKKRFGVFELNIELLTCLSTHRVDWGRCSSLTRTYTHIHLHDAFIKMSVFPPSTAA